MDSRDYRQTKYTDHFYYIYTSYTILIPCCVLTVCVCGQCACPHIVSVHVSVGQHHGRVVLVHHLPRDLTHQPGVGTVSHGEGLGQKVQPPAAHGAVRVLRGCLVLIALTGPDKDTQTDTDGHTHTNTHTGGRIRCLDGRQAGLQCDGEHRVVPQLVQPVVIVAELLDQHLPAGGVQEVLGSGCQGEGGREGDAHRLLPTVCRRC